MAAADGSGTDPAIADDTHRSYRWQQDTQSHPRHNTHRTSSRYHTHTVRVTDDPDGTSQGLSGMA